MNRGLENETARPFNNASGDSDARGGTLPGICPVAAGRLASSKKKAEGENPFSNQTSDAGHYRITKGKCQGYRINIGQRPGKVRLLS